MISSEMASRLNLFILLLLFSFVSPAFSQSQSETHSSHCGPQDVVGERCYDTATALRLKLIAIASILLTSTIGVSLPIFSRSVPALHPDRDLFSVVKAFSSGVILATGYMHVLPDSFNCLSSPCLPENPWRRFPFTTFVAMLSALFTLMVDSFSMSYYRKRFLRQGNENCGETGKEMSKLESDRQNHGHGISTGTKNDDSERSSQLLRHRVVAQVLEMGIVVHSVVIGLSMGASENPCTIRPLIAALCFHQLFEGMGLGGCILQAEYGRRMKAVMVFFFSITTPVGIALGIGLTKVYSESSPAALIVVGLLNASSAGLLNYMALVDLLASDFMAPKLQSSFKLQLWAYLAVFLGAGGMSVMAIWA